MYFSSVFRLHREKEGRSWEKEKTIIRPPPTIISVNSCSHREYMEVESYQFQIFYLLLRYIHLHLSHVLTFGFENVIKLSCTQASGHSCWGPSSSLQTRSCTKVTLWFPVLSPVPSCTPEQPQSSYVLAPWPYLPFPATARIPCLTHL